MTFSHLSWTCFVPGAPPLSSKCQISQTSKQGIDVISTLDCRDCFKALISFPKLSWSKTAQTLLYWAPSLFASRENLLACSTTCLGEAPLIVLILRLETNLLKY